MVSDSGYGRWGRKMEVGGGVDDGAEAVGCGAVLIADGTQSQVE